MPKKVKTAKGEMYRNGFLLENEHLKEFKKLRKKFGKECFWFDHEIDFFAGDKIKITRSKIMTDSDERVIQGIFMAEVKVGNNCLYAIKVKNRLIFIPTWTIIGIELIKRLPNHLEMLTERDNLLEKISEEGAEGITG